MWKLCNLTFFTVGTSLYHVFFPSFTGYLEQGLMVKDPKKLRKNYINSTKVVILDVLSILPTGYSLSVRFILLSIKLKYNIILLGDLLEFPYCEPVFVVSPGFKSLPGYVKFVCPFSFHYQILPKKLIIRI